MEHIEYTYVDEERQKEKVEELVIYKRKFIQKYHLQLTSEDIWVRNANDEYPRCILTHEQMSKFGMKPIVFIYYELCQHKLSYYVIHHYKYLPYKHDPILGFIPVMWYDAECICYEPNGRIVDFRFLQTLTTNSQFEAFCTKLESLDQLEIIPDPKYLGIPNINFSLTCSHDSREEEYHQQRIIRGFDMSELWNLDATISKFILPRLKAFREESPGFPSCFETKDEWKNVLGKMIDAFENIIDDNDREVNIIDPGLELFRRYFYMLWY